MNDKQKKFIEENFKAGEYVTLKIMVQTKQLDKLIAHLKASNCNLVMFPETQAKLDFASDKKKGPLQ